MNERNILGTGIAAFLLIAGFCIWHHALSPAAQKQNGGAQQQNGAQGNTAPVPATALPAPRLGVAAANGKVTLTGRVADEATKADLLKHATEVYGAGNFVDEIKVTGAGAEAVAATTPAWVTRAHSLMGLAKTYPNFNGNMDLTGKSLTLSGLVPDEPTRNKLAYDAKSAVGPEVTLIERLTLGTVGAGPAPTPDKPLNEEEAQIQKSLNDELTGKIVEFDTAKADITPAGKAVLDALLPILKAAPGTNMEIGGHTDSQGNAAKNLDLSQRRAVAVRAYLAANGIAENTLTAKGYGAAQPVADNKTEAGRQRNRRIAFKVLAK